jgi:hypothetical protein
MAIMVAPLTTVVMSSVDGKHVGTASGINNALARVAGVLAIAVLGIVMVNAFASRLNRRIAQLPLPADVVQTLKANEIELAGLQVPAGLAPTTRTAIRESIREGFVFGFRAVMLILRRLGVLSAAVAWLMIPKDSS